MSTKRKLCMAVFVCTQILYSFTAYAASYGDARWDEKDNRIQLQSVCANHKYGSIKSRECRAKVSKHFNRQCEKYTQRYNDSSTGNRTKYKNSKTKYCYAARHFKIVD